MAGLSINLIAKVADEIERSQGRLILKAAAHVRKALLTKAKQTFTKRSGDLFKGIIAEGRGDSIHHFNRRSGSDKKGVAYAVVGFTRPAYHAHLLEFGTADRTVQNYMGKKGKAVNVGKVTAKPFVAPTFAEEKGAVQDILSGAWL